MKRVQRFLALLLVLSLSAATVLAIVIKDRPTAVQRNGVVLVTWSTADESGVQKFEVWRAQVNGNVLGEFKPVGSQNPLGNNSTYQFEDMDVFKSTDGVFAYKVRVVFTNGGYSDSEVTRAAVLSSTAKRTWGSIKAMFR